MSDTNLEKADFVERHGNRAVSLKDLLDVNKILRRFVTSTDFQEAQEEVILFVISRDVRAEEAAPDRFRSVGEVISEMIVDGTGAADPDGSERIRSAIDRMRESTTDDDNRKSREVKAAPAKSRAQATRKMGDLTEDELGVAFSMHDAGKSNGEIAKALNRWTGQINVVLRNRAKDRADAPVPVRTPTPPPPPAPRPRPVDVPPPQKPTAVDDDTLRNSGVMPIWEKNIRAHLSAVGHKAPWNPAADLHLVGQVLAGPTWDVLLDELGVEKADAAARFRLLVSNSTDPIHQSRVLGVLRSVAGEAGGR